MDAARAAAERGDWSGCLRALLAMWRAHPDPALAALIEDVSPRVPAPPVADSTVAALRARIARASADDIEAILTAASRMVRTLPHAYGLVVELARSQPPDPRIARALVAIIEEPPFAELTFNAKGALLADVTRALHAIDDPRFRSVLVAESQRLEQHRRYIRKRKAGLDALKEIATEVATRSPPPSLDLGDLPAAIACALERATAAAPRGRDAGELLAAIYADPADVSLRLVYADVLQERGDQRGELIALQCARADDAEPSRRERQLLRTYARTWLDEIEPIVQKHGLVYQRGFLAAACEAVKFTMHAPLLRSPIWSTIEALDVTKWDDEGVRFLARLRALRRVWSVHGRETLLALAARGEPLPWTTLGVKYPGRSTWMATAALLPALVELDLTQTAALEHLPAIADSPLVDRLTRYRVATHRVAVARILAAVPTRAAVELVPAYTFPGDPEGAAVVVAGAHATLVHHDQKIDGRYAASILAALAPGRLTSIGLQAPTKARVDAAGWALLATQLLRHGLTLAQPG